MAKVSSFIPEDEWSIWSKRQQKLFPLSWCTENPLVTLFWSQLRTAVFYSKCTGTLPFPTQKTSKQTVLVHVHVFTSTINKITFGTRCSPWSQCRWCQTSPSARVAVIWCPQIQWRCFQDETTWPAPPSRWWWLSQHWRAASANQRPAPGSSPQTWRSSCSEAEPVGREVVYAHVAITTKFYSTIYIYIYIYISIYLSFFYKHMYVCINDYFRLRYVCKHCIFSHCLSVFWNEC